MKFVVIPNASVFNFTEPHHLYFSRNDSLKEIELKVQRCLANYLFTKMKNKETVVRKIHIWKSRYEDITDVWKLDKAWKSKSQTKVKADLLNDPTHNKETV